MANHCQSWPAMASRGRGRCLPGYPDRPAAKTGRGDKCLCPRNGLGDGLAHLWRKTYKLIAGYWPTAPGGRPFKGEINGTPKLVFSRTLERVDWLKFRLATASPRRSRA